MNNDVMILNCGVTLHLQAVQETILQDLMLEFGDMALIRQPERILQLQGAQQVRALAATGKLFTYCAGWGVVTNPPDEANELMELLGRDTAVDKPHLHRANWVRTITSQQERGELIGRVMAISFPKKETAVAEPAPSDEHSQRMPIAELTKQLANGREARIAELEAQLAALTQANGHTAVTAPAQPEGEG
jgi:hypothetical protein